MLYHKTTFLELIALESSSNTASKYQEIHFGRGKAKITEGR